MSPIATRADGEQAIDNMMALIREMTGVVEQEMALVHAGRIRAAAALEPTKAQLSGQLFKAGERLKGSARFLLQALPERCAALAGVQESLRAVLQRNMIVLATAHAVSEGIMRRLSGDLARQASPQTYGASGRATAPNPRSGRPLAISRTL